MPTMLSLPEGLYHQAEEAADSQGLSVEEFVARIVAEKLGDQSGAPRKAGKVILPLVPSTKPGSRPLSAERVSELLNEGDDVSP